MVKDKFYISTAIAYTSAKPHIGNTYEVVLADAIARYKRLQGYDVYFQTGTDEHGEKIEIKAKEAGVTPLEYVDKISNEIKNIWDVMNTSYDCFVRTTDKNHEKTVQEIFEKFYEQGDIYKGEYKGLYCIECFHPYALYWFKKNRPEVIRGQLSEQFLKEKEEGTLTRKIGYFIVKNLLTNFITKPDFIAYHYKYKDCLPLKICRRFYKIPIYGWTFRDKKAYKENEPYFEGFIFEKFVL